MWTVGEAGAARTSVSASADGVTHVEARALGPRLKSTDSCQHAHMHARARTHARTNARTHARTHAHSFTHSLPQAPTHLHWIQTSASGPVARSRVCVWLDALTWRVCVWLGWFDLESGSNIDGQRLVPQPNMLRSRLTIQAQHTSACSPAHARMQASTHTCSHIHARTHARAHARTHVHQRTVAHTVPGRTLAHTVPGRW